MIDFQNIRGGVAGQREAFEELVCQIARRSPPEHALQYHRIHGAGGDGGIEAYWLLNDGSKHGFQAKFHVRSGDVDWSAIDKSVEAALSAHPKLTKYCVAIACDLTGPVPKRRGKPGWEHWKAHQKTWEDSAKNHGMNVEFVPWTASTIDDLLATPAMCGLREYWFGTIELSSEWLLRQCRRTVEALEERYHPEDHVEVRAKACFDGLLRNETWRKVLRDAVENVTDHAKISVVSKSLKQGSRTLILSIADGMPRLDELKQTIDLSASEAFPRQIWIETCEFFNDLAYKAQQSLFADQRKAKEAAEKAKKPPSQNHFAGPGDDIYPSIRDVHAFRSAVNALSELLDTFQIKADQTRFSLIEGRAGSGKSHLLAAEVENALSLGAPCLFLLGTQFSGTTHPQQDLLRHFDFTHQRYDAFLGAFSAAAESAGLRGLIVIDAINEGAGINLWRTSLAEFIGTVLSYPNLAVCVSCRSEYSKALIVNAVRERATHVSIRGFETEVERENAAQTYMDRRGIVRPATPWLNPEFTNPLFLRTACLALQRSKRSEFPKGLRGTKELLHFFLDATADALGTSYDGTGLLKRPVTLSVLGTAKEMAAKRQDFLTVQEAATLIDSQFRGLSLPANGASWLDTLKHNGLLRFDPEPNFDPKDPLQFPQDVVRFSFQRFQDHLIAEAILESVSKPLDLFSTPDGLNFMLNEYGIRWEWRGLAEALSIQVPEKYQLEMVDLMPGGFESWWGDDTVQDCFVESVRWRSVSAFSDRSLALLNQLVRHKSEIVSLLIELSVVKAHPWNAELLHRNLMRRKLAERDQFWTLSINEANGDASHPANRLIEWSFGTGRTKAEDTTIFLALMTLTWLTTSTAATIRDKATKALTALLIERSHLFSPLLEQFGEVDDPYVRERILAAAYGSCCIEPLPERLTTFSLAIFNFIFASERVPPHLLMRDYARGVIEIAQKFDCLPSEVELQKCLPPYHSSKPSFSVNKERVLARSERLGASRITSSCFDGLADFGRYTVEGRIREFTNASLSGPQPISFEERYENSRAHLVRSRPNVETAFSDVEKAYRRNGVNFDPETHSFTIPELDHVQIKAAEKKLRVLIGNEQFALYLRECCPKLRGENAYRTWYLSAGKIATGFDANKAKYWIANRAMALGWTNKLFPHDSSGGEDRVRGSKVERIGKKYQRIALQELLAKLADNYWLAPDYDGPSRTYDNPLDISFIRDIDPTILPDCYSEGTSSSVGPTIQKLNIPDLVPSAMQAWLEDADLPEQKLRLALCADLNSPDWVALYRYASCDIDADSKKSVLESPWKQSEFHFLVMHILKPAERKRLIAFAPQAQMDFHEWLPHDVTDGPYLGELGVRDTWKPDFWEKRDARTLDTEEFELASPVSGYCWESHLDGSLPGGVSVHIPQPWLLEHLGLKADPQVRGAYVDQFGELIICSNRDERNSFCLARKDRLMALLDEKGLSPLWSVIGERMAWWDGDTVRGKRVRFNGMLWFQGKRAQSNHWSKFD